MVKQVVRYRGAVEGQQEKMYFEHLENLINENDKYKKRVNFLLKNKHGGCPTDIVNKAIKQRTEKSDNIVAVYDRDFKDDFISSIELCKKNKVMSAYSNQNFNLFLILHKKYTHKQTTKEDKYEKELKKCYNLDDDCDIKNADIIQKILDQITIEDINRAIKNMKKLNLETEKIGEEISPNIYEQPYLKICDFLEEIFVEINK